jgi:hypothetical protein
MIHLLAWTAVLLQATISYNRRFDPGLYARGLEHRMELPALAFACVLLLVLVFLISLAGVPPAGPTKLPASLVIWVPLT